MTAEYIQRLEDLVRELERETGDKYEIELRKFCGKTTTICPFAKRQVHVHSMKPEYKELEGYYVSCGHVAARINELKFTGLEMVDGRWRCPRCGYYERNCLYNELCQGRCNVPGNNCDYNVSDSKWMRVRVFGGSGCIGIAGGGTLSEVKPIGSLSLLG